MIVKVLTSPSSAELVHTDDDVSLCSTIYLVALETLVHLTVICTSVLDYSESPVGAVGTTGGPLVVIETADDTADDPALLLAETAMS